MDNVPVQPAAVDNHSLHHVALHERVMKGQGLLIAGDGIIIEVNDRGQYILRIKKSSTPSEVLPIWI